MSTTVLSIRIRRELKEEAEELGIDIRTIVEKALEEEIRRAKFARFRKLLEEALSSTDITVDEWVRTVEEGSSRGSFRDGCRVPSRCFGSVPVGTTVKGRVPRVR